MKIQFKLRCLATSMFLLVLMTAAAIDLQQLPKTNAGNAPPLSPLLVAENGRAITTKGRWQKQRELLKKQWLEALGCKIPNKRAALKTQVLQTEELLGFTRQYLKYQVDENIFTDGYLLTPKCCRLPAGRGKGEKHTTHPAIVVFHPTTPLQAKGVAGLAPEYAEEKRQGIQLVQRGYIVWCPRNYIFDEVPGATNGTKLYMANVERVQKLHPTWTGMARMVYDAVRAADFLESLPSVDKRRIGGIGHSLGGKQVFYAAAFDERYKAVVSSEGGIGLNFSNWEASWYLGDQIKRSDWKLENHQVLSFVAPRAFLLLAGDSADNDKSWAFIEGAKPVYDLLGVPKNIGWFNHHLGHRYAPEAREVAEKFLDEHLKN